VCVGLGRDFAQLVDHVLWWRQIGVAHAQVDDVAPGASRGGSHAVDFGDDIGRQALHAVEFIVHGGSLVTFFRRRDAALRQTLRETRARAKLAQ